jgi:hypothetical protein
VELLALILQRFGDSVFSAPGKPLDVYKRCWWHDSELVAGEDATLIIETCYEEILTLSESVRKRSCDSEDLGVTSNPPSWLGLCTRLNSGTNSKIKAVKECTTAI